MPKNILTIQEMIMTTNFPWEILDQPSDRNVTIRRIFEESLHNIFIARDSEDNYQAIFQLKEMYKSLLKDSNISINSLQIELAKQPNNSFLLIIKLTNKDNLKIFDHILYAILKDLVYEKDEKGMVINFVRRLKNWQKFMQASKSGILSEEKIQGLLAEIFLMFNLIKNNPDKSELIINSWCGPSGLQQDFIFNNLAIEVKSIGNMDKKTISISSLEQLQSNVSNLYLSVFKTIKTDIQDHIESWSLNGLIDEMLNLLKCDEKTEIISKLLELGYVKDEKYDKSIHKIQLIGHYKVDDDFPKLTSRGIPNGVVNVKYDIDLNKIEQYKTDLILKNIL